MADTADDIEPTPEQIADAVHLNIAAGISEPTAATVRRVRAKNLMAIGTAQGAASFQGFAATARTAECSRIVGKAARLNHNRI